MTVIHANFGGASAPPTPAAPNLTTDQVGLKIVQWAADSARLGSNLSDDERKARFNEVLAMAERVWSVGLAEASSLDFAICVLIEARMLKATPGAQSVEEAQPGAPLGARELADAAIRWINEEVAVRSTLSPEERRARADAYMDTAIECLEDPKAPVWASAIGRNAWGARIMMAERD